MQKAQESRELTELIKYLYRITIALLPQASSLKETLKKKNPTQEDL